MRAKQGQGGGAYPAAAMPPSANRDRFSMGDMSREPSMEEILSSIRRVISRDESARGAGPLRSGNPAAQGESESNDDGAQDDVLELTEMSGDVMGRRSVSDGAADQTPSPAVDPAELLSPVSAAASRQSIDALAAVLAGGREGATPSAAGVSGDMTLHALVEAALRPMLKQWLDANLPSMVERIVATEIARITGRR